MLAVEELREILDAGTSTRETKATLQLLKRIDHPNPSDVQTEWSHSLA